MKNIFSPFEVLERKL